MTDVLLEARDQAVFTWGASLTAQGGLEVAGAARSEYIESLREADMRRFDRLIRFVRM